MHNFKDITGKKFGKLTVVSRHFPKEKKNITYWLCKCDCGKFAIVSKPNLTSLHTTSCGCYSKELKLNNKYNLKHGESRTRLYHIWQSIKQRCYDKNVSEFHYYGGRGIKMCKEWQSYIVFSNWAKLNGYSKELTIERIDVDGNYCPENCTWASVKAQNRNRRNTIFLTYGESTRSMGEWSEILNIPMSTMVNRKNRGCTVDEILNTNYKRRKQCHLTK